MPKESGELDRILKSMVKWRQMDEPARRLGRGLGRRELASRVARDVGASVVSVLLAIKANIHE